MVTFKRCDRPRVVNQPRDGHCTKDGNFPRDCDCSRDDDPLMYDDYSRDSEQ